MRAPIFEKPEGGKVKLGEHALGRMLAFVQDTQRKREAGGVLLGRHIVDSLDVVVDEVTTPMRGDQRSRAGFYRDRRRHQAVIDRLWRESDSTCAYLGEWHTHPEPHPKPSPHDLQDWQRKLKEDVFAGSVLHFVIVGTQTGRVWVWNRNTQICSLVGEFDHRRPHACKGDWSRSERPSRVQGSVISRSC